MMQEVNDTFARQPYYSAAELITLIVAVANAIILIRSNWNTKEIRNNLRENTAMTSATLTEAKVISGHVNSERSKLDERIVGKERENELLIRQLEDSTKTAALLAQTAAVTVGKRQPDPGPHDRRAEDKAAAETLAQIEANTRDTADGIQELKG